MIFFLLIGRGVAKDYDGIEIAPYQESLRYDLEWYYGWDVASGCIWNFEGIRLNKIVDI